MMSAMDTLRNCNVVFGSEEHNALDAAQVQIEGEDGSGTVTISRIDRHSRKFRRVEQLKKATWKKRGKTYHISGVSTMLKAGPDNNVQVQVVPNVPSKDKV
jgi:hypothetical protein